MSDSVNPATKAVRASIDSDEQHSAIVPPLYLSSNFSFQQVGVKGKYYYTRSGNPPRTALVDALAERVDHCIEAGIARDAIVIDPGSYLYLIGMTLDFDGGLHGQGFTFSNPNATKTCGCGASFAV